MVKVIQVFSQVFVADIPKRINTISPHPAQFIPSGMLYKSSRA
jgi:hypothetical protein